MPYPKIPLAQSIIEICRAKELFTVVISPGSRNAPLTIGFTKNSEFNCYSVVDERCAAFFALGIAQQTQKPVALLCTSGSALLNYYPAVAEAFYSQIPLVVLSADRPIDKIDIGDGQTIRQQNVFENHSLYNANLIADVCDENDVKICKAIDTSISKKGPVHINIPFEEPLYELTENLVVSPKITSIEKSNEISENLAPFASIWNSSEKKLILIGAQIENEISDEILNFWASDSSIVVMTETTSNVHHPSFINTIDSIITPFEIGEYENFKPDLLTTIGGMFVSKRIKAMLRTYKPKHHWHIDSLRAYDTFGCLTKHFKINVNDFFENFNPLLIEVESNYKSLASKIKKLRAEKTEKYLSEIEFSDFKVFEKILKHIPFNSNLQISNSSAIRYAQLFDIEKSIGVFCNRGTSGIDGSTSTAIGAAVASTKQTTLITGDIGFFYDSNALWNNYIPKNFKIIVINNGGGGIFRILPGHDESPVFNTYFETEHHLNASHYAKMYDFEYFSANDENSFDFIIDDFFNINEKPSILEIFTPTKVNDKILLNYFKNLT